MLEMYEPRQQKEHSESEFSLCSFRAIESVHQRRPHTTKQTEIGHRSELRHPNVFGDPIAHVLGHLVGIRLWIILSHPAVHSRDRLHEHVEQLLFADALRCGDVEQTLAGLPLRQQLTLADLQHLDFAQINRQFIHRK